MKTEAPHPLVRPCARPRSFTGALWRTHALRKGGALMLGIALAAAMAAGCSTNKAPASTPGTTVSQAQRTEGETGQPVPSASVEIEYAHNNDTLKSFLVTQFTGATVLFSRRVDAEHEAAVVRFDGGIPVWQFHSKHSILNPLAVFESARYHVTKVQYGKVPPGFAQDIPDFGPPPPLEPDNYYVFTIERSSGALSYQAIKVNADGSLEAYDAEPRAGTSYRLCCNLSPDFVQSSSASADLMPEP
jgi:hypothetical protein